MKPSIDRSSLLLDRAACQEITSCHNTLKILTDHRRQCVLAASLPHTKREYQSNQRRRQGLNWLRTVYALKREKSRRQLKRRVSPKSDAVTDRYACINSSGTVYNTSYQKRGVCSAVQMGIKASPTRSLLRTKKLVWATRERNLTSIHVRIYEHAHTYVAVKSDRPAQRSNFKSRRDVMDSKSQTARKYRKVGVCMYVATTHLAVGIGVGGPRN